MAGTKPAEWFQQLYALLNDEASNPRQMKNLRIVRLRDGDFSTAGQSFFASDHSSDRIATVDERVYSSGRSKPQQEKARKFLADLGVRELGEAEEVELILKTRYTKEAEIPDKKTYLRDLKRFVALAEQQPEKAKLFAIYYIYQGRTDVGIGRRPSISISPTDPPISVHTMAPLEKKPTARRSTVATWIAASRSNGSGRSRKQRASGWDCLSTEDRAEIIHNGHTCDPLAAIAGPRRRTVITTSHISQSFWRRPRSNSAV